MLSHVSRINENKQSNVLISSEYISITSQGVRPIRRTGNKFPDESLACRSFFLLGFLGSITLLSNMDPGYDHLFKLLLIGDSGVGKSSLLDRKSVV